MSIGDRKLEGQLTHNLADAAYAHGDFADALEKLRQASSLLEGLDLPQPVDHRIAWGPRETYLLGRLTEALAGGDSEIVLTERDIERLVVEHPLPLPDAFAALARLEAASEQAGARGDFRLYLASVSGPSGARLLGRFCHADPELAACVERHVRAEAALRPEAAFAPVLV